LKRKTKKTFLRTGSLLKDDAGYIYIVAQTDASIFKAIALDDGNRLADPGVKAHHVDDSYGCYLEDLQKNCEATENLRPIPGKLVVKK
jgi:hypothetical protein